MKDFDGNTRVVPISSEQLHTINQKKKISGWQWNDEEYCVLYSDEEYSDSSSLSSSSTSKCSGLSCVSTEDNGFIYEIKYKTIIVEETDFLEE